MACEDEIRLTAHQYYLERCSGPESAAEDWQRAVGYHAWMDKHSAINPEMSFEEQVRYVAAQLWTLNGKQEGFAAEDWALAEALVKEYRSNGQRCAPVTIRDLRSVIVTVSPGHSSY